MFSATQKTQIGSIVAMSRILLAYSFLQKCLPRAVPAVCQSSEGELQAIAQHNDESNSVSS